MKIHNYSQRYFTTIIFILFTAFLLTTCEKKDPVDDLIEFVWIHSASHPDGFTLDLTTKTSVTSGIVAAYEETQNSFGKESLRKVITHSLSHESIVGGWFNTTDSNYYFDSSIVFSDTSLAEAITFARENHQLAIYDLTHDSTITITYPVSYLLLQP